MPALMAIIGGNANPLQREFAKVRGMAGALGSHLGGKLAGFVSLGALEEGIRRTTDYMESLKDLASRTGQSTDVLQKWGYAAAHASTNLDEMVTAFEKFQILQAKAIAGGDEGDKAAATLGRLGLSKAEISNIDEAGRNFETVAERIKKAKIVGQMLADVTEAFGKSARQIIPVFKQDLKAAGDELERIGGLMKSSDIAAGATAAERMKMAWWQMRPIIASVISFAARRMYEIADFFRLTLGVMFVDLEARKNAVPRAETFWGRTKENWRGQKDKAGNVEQIAADARNKYIDKILKEREARAAALKKMEEELKHPQAGMPPYAPSPDNKKPDKETSHMKLLQGSVNQLQAVGAYGSPASVALVDVAKKSLHHLKNIDAKLKPAEGAYSDTTRKGKF